MSPVAVDTVRFANPEMAAWLLVIFPVVTAAWLFVCRQRFRSSGRPLIRSRRRVPAAALTTLALSLIAATLLVGALMVPQVWLEQSEPVYERPDLIIVLDRSLSMQATDIVPARLSRATEEIKGLLGQRSTALGRIGLVTFSGTSVILSYLTSDRDNILFYLDWMVEEPRLLFGTSIGAALASAREVAERDESDVPKLFILLSDGEDFGGRLAEEVAGFQQRNWRIHTIGLGARGAVPIPLPAVEGQPAGYLLDERGEVVFTEFDETTLRWVAETTGGLFVRSTSGGELAGALAEILDSQLRIIDWETTGEYRDVHRWVLMLASAALMLMVALL